MEKKLIDYGIQNERSDWRVHVCPKAKSVYIYPTDNGVATIDNKHYRLAKGYQRGVEYATAKGYLVPPFDIPKCVGIRFRQTTWDFFDFRDEDSPSEKGQKAVNLVIAMIKVGFFPVLGSSSEPSGRSIQVSGTDIFVVFQGHRLKMQVKCDYPGGEQELGGTGNLYLQVAELNPLSRH